MWSFIQVSSEPKSLAETPESVWPELATPLRAFLDLVGKQDARRHGVGDSQCLADVALGLPHERPHQRTNIEDQRRAARLLSQALGELRLPRAGDPQQQKAPRPLERIAASRLQERALAEGLKRRQTTKAFKAFRAAVELQQAALLEHLAFQLPHGIGFDLPGSNQGQAEGGFRLIASQARRGIQHTVQCRTIRKLACFRGNSAGNLLQLLAVG